MKLIFYKKMKRGFRKAVFIVGYSIDKKGKIECILLKRKLHWHGWEFPKGKIERFEFKRCAAKRELREETGLKIVCCTIKNFHIKGKYLYHKYLIDRPKYKGQTYNLFSAQVKKGRISLDPKEHEGHIWLSYNKAIRKLTWPNQKKCLKVVNDWLIGN
jgi:8-oxo-dGTP pyrophosphatase MutT (NUDIX family)